MKVGCFLAACAIGSAFFMAVVAGPSYQSMSQPQGVVTLMIPFTSSVWWWSTVLLASEIWSSADATTSDTNSATVTVARSNNNENINTEFMTLDQQQQQQSTVPDFTLQCLEPSDSSEKQLFTPTLQCIYRDEHLFPDNVRLEVPTHFVKLSRERVFQEINAYLLHPQRWWSERVVLEVFFYATVQANGTGLPSAIPTTFIPSRLEKAQGWLRDDVDVCDWEGITCGEITFGPGRWVDEPPPAPGIQQAFLDEDADDQDTPQVPVTAVTKIDLTHYNLVGTLPSELAMLRHLRRLDLKSNHLQGTVPTTYPHLTYLEYLDLGHNALHGTIPETYSLRRLHLRELRLPNNQFSGSLLPKVFAGWSHMLRVLDLSKNRFSGALHDDLFPYYLSELSWLSLSHNNFTGSIPTQLGNLTKVQVLHMVDNQFTGKMPSEIGQLYLYLQDLNLAGNWLTGSIPTQIMSLAVLHSLVLRDNRLTGTVPEGDDRLKGRRRRSKQKTGAMWSHFQRLMLLDVGSNKLTGTLPPELAFGLTRTLTSLDISGNRFSGTIPPEISQLSVLQRLDASRNKFTGSIPMEMQQLNRLIQLNLTDNLLTGTVPQVFCQTTRTTMSSSRQLGCSAVLCPAGSYHPEGAATMYSACRPCPPSMSSPTINAVIGRTTCDSDTGTFLFGDVNGDGVLSQREVLFVFFLNTMGPSWGSQFQSWGDIDVHECILAGVTCVAGQVAKIDLSDATLCAKGHEPPSTTSSRPCLGISPELSFLPNLEVLQLHKQSNLIGTIPTQFGRLKKLRFLDISHCSLITGTIPTQVGRMTNLRQLVMQATGLRGTIPNELFRLISLEKLFLSMNALTGTLPTLIGRLENLKELTVSRTKLNGTIPTELGRLIKLENLEMYGNYFVGHVPKELGSSTNLKRIDFFNNGLTGTLPESLSNIKALQILHIKLNALTGTVPSKFGELPHITWFDVSNNQLHGTIPFSFAYSPTIKDFRFGGNMIYDPIPQPLCSNTRINGGATRKHSCDGVICPLGTYSDIGHATIDEPCRPCSEGQTSMYLGSATCRSFSTRDLLSIFFDVMGGENWPPHLKRGWKEAGTHECSWAGVTCDDNKELINLGFPVSNVKW